jgi:protoporphyrinogen oxidase
VIGAGPSGLTAAYNLQLKGYKTVIFDKQAEVGGKCQAYYDK